MANQAIKLTLTLDCDSALKAGQAIQDIAVTALRFAPHGITYDEMRAAVAAIQFACELNDAAKNAEINNMLGGAF